MSRYRVPLVSNINFLFPTMIMVGLLSFPYQSLQNPIPDDSSSINSFDLCETTNTVFKHGEEVVYKVYYNWNFIWLAAGEVTFRVEERGNTYKLSAVGKTYASYEWFFKVKDVYEAVVDKETLMPISTVRDIEEGGYRLYERVEYHKGKPVVTSYRRRGQQTESTKDFTLNGCTHDVLSAIYFTRNQDFSEVKKGATFPMRLFLDREEYNLKIKYLGKIHHLDVKGMGKFKAIGLSPETIAGTVFSEGAVMKLFATDDANKIPVLIESPVSVGSIKAVLKSHKNLKYPMAAKL